MTRDEKELKIYEKPAFQIGTVASSSWFHFLMFHVDNTCNVIKLKEKK